MSSQETPPEQPEPEPTGRSNVAALVFVVLLFLGALWVFQLLEHHREIDNCIASGRRDCVDLTGKGTP